MWHTPIGDRHLLGQEAELVRSSLGMLVDQVSLFVETELEDPSVRWACGPGAFDQLTATQQLAVLYEVARHLLTDTPTPLPLTAVTESVIGTIFDQIRTGVEMECEDQERGEDWQDRYADYPTWREQILAAYEETLSEDEREELMADGSLLPSADESDMEQWDQLIESLIDRILWDRDYEMESLLLDADPVKASRMKQFLGVDNNYYSEIAPETRPRDVGPLLNKIKAITHISPF